MKRLRDRWIFQLLLVALIGDVGCSFQIDGCCFADVTKLPDVKLRGANA